MVALKQLSDHLADLSPFVEILIRDRAITYLVKLEQFSVLVFGIEGKLNLVV